MLFVQRTHCLNEKETHPWPGCLPLRPSLVLPSLPNSPSLLPPTSPPPTSLSLSSSLPGLPSLALTRTPPPLALSHPSYSRRPRASAASCSTSARSARSGPRRGATSWPVAEIGCRAPREYDLTEKEKGNT